jgi:ABC-type transport system involved in cytochrome c biogenesis permease subunit
MSVIEAPATPVRARDGSSLSGGWKIVQLLASLRLTVVLFALAMFLIFMGTLAQVNMGIWEVMSLYFRSFIVWIELQLFVPLPGVRVPGSVPFPGGFTIGGLMMVNLLAAHAVRFRLRWSRVGIIVLHLGIIVLILGEVATALLAEEGNMTIDQGSWANFVEDIREAELAVVGRGGQGDKETRGQGEWANGSGSSGTPSPSPAPERRGVKVVAVPESYLTEVGRVMSHEALPFEVRVERWIGHSQVVSLEGRRETEATHGAGVRFSAMEQPPARGVDGAGANLPSAYVTLLRDGRELGRWLLSLHLRPQEVEVDGQVYEIALRFKRTYKPYTMHLIEFRHDRFVGTEKPRNFSSRIRLVDPEQNEDREVLIYMNHPLRYRGATFYQSAYKEGDTGTILQVVRNPGWLLPYVACVLVGVGMVVHFGGMLVAFARRGRAGPQSTTSSPRLEVSDWRSWLVPVVVVLLAVAFVGSRALKPEPRGEFDLATLGKVPVSADGRVKPLDTVARSKLMIVSGRQTLPDKETRGQGDKETGDAGGLPEGRVEAASGASPSPAPSLEGRGTRSSSLRDSSAMRWLMDVIARTDEARRYEVVRVDHPEVLGLLDRGPEEGNRLSMDQVMPHWPKIVQQATAALEMPHRRRGPFHRNVIELYSHVNLFMVTAMMEAPYTVPPLREGEQWRPFPEAMRDAERDGLVNPAVEGMTAIFTAYHEGDAARFNREAAAYLDFMRHALPSETRKAAIEVWFNRVEPFYLATVLYVGVFLLACGGMMARTTVGARVGDVETFTDRSSAGLRPAAKRGWAEALLRGAFWLMVVTFILHTVGLGLRIYLQGRPPVTNLYSSAVFVGWACVLLAVVVERWYPLGFGSMAAGVVGCGTLIVAHNLAVGDTMEMMQAVLDSNFWLATHVITITIGYSAVFLAGFLGVIYIVMGVFTRRLSREWSKALGKMVYGVICFALLFSFVGTVLGGIWADQSWGRFWGWDPKENGAALIVLMTALILHARWAGMVGERGMMVLAAGGNIVTAWSWFGTNMLGIGLHSYGFMDSAAFWLFMFILSQLAVMGVGVLPRESWRSFPPDLDLAAGVAKEDKMRLVSSPPVAG